jgi:hypothetical protein
MSGQVLVESLITYFMLTLLFFISMEVIRLVAVKAYVQNYANMVTRDLAFQAGYFLKENSFNNEALQKNLNEEIKNNFQKNFQLRDISRYSFAPSEREGVLALNTIPVKIDLKTPWAETKAVNAKEEFGVYTSMYVCIPVMFSSVYEYAKGDTTMGHDVNSSGSQDCLGQYFSQDVRGIFWFRIRVASYAPWPASLEILTHGYGLPTTVAHLETEIYDDTLRGLDNMPLTKYLSPQQKPSEIPQGGFSNATKK